MSIPWQAPGQVCRAHGDRLQENLTLPLSRRQRWALAAGAVAVGLALAGVVAARSNVGRALVKTFLPGWAPAAVVAEKPAAPPFPESVFDCQPTAVPWVEPGTVIDRGPPTDWSHLIIKNDTQVTAGETGGNAETWNRMATLFALAVLADVGQDTSTLNYYLARLGLGWCDQLNGRDTVISTATYGKLGAKLDALQVLSLGMREIDCDDNVRVIARSASTLFYDVKRVLAHGPAHIEGRLRHAILVHPRTGELAALLWIVPAEGQEPPAFLERLPPSYVTTFELQFRPSRGNLLSMPSPEDFAVRGVPVCAERVPVTPDLATVALAVELNADTAGRLESLLRAAFGWQ